MKNESNALTKEFVEALEHGLKADSAKVQALVARHYAWITKFWTPDEESYVGLGQLYVEHPDFRKYYEAYHPELAEFLAEAMRVYANKKLA